MKKTLSFILSMVMLLSCAITLLTNVAAETVAEAPADVRFQDTDVVNNTQDIRFIAGVKNLNGSVLGYKIVAEYTHNSEYKRTKYEDSSSVVFESIVADNETLEPTSDKLYGADTEYQYLFTMKITGVPTNIGAIYFRIWTYVQVGEEKIWSEETNVQYIDGENDTSLIYYNFENVNAFADLQWKMAREQYSGTNNTVYPAETKDNPASVIREDANGNKYLYQCGGGNTYQVVPDSMLEGITKYTIEMDVNITGAGKIGLIFNNASEDVDGDSAQEFGNHVYMRIRGWNYTSNKIPSPDGVTADDGMVINIKGFYNSSNGLEDRYYCPNDTGKTYKHPYKFGTDLHFTVTVDTVNKILTICINGQQLFSETLAYTTVGGVYLSNQNAPMTIDNIRVYGE